MAGLERAGVPPRAKSISEALDSIFNEARDGHIDPALIKFLDEANAGNVGRHLPNVPQVVETSEPWVRTFAKVGSNQAVHLVCYPFDAGNGPPELQVHLVEAHWERGRGKVKEGVDLTFDPKSGDLISYMPSSPGPNQKPLNPVE